MMVLKFFFYIFCKVKNCCFFCNVLYCCKEYVLYVKIFINLFELYKYLVKKIYKYIYICRLFVG